MTTPVQKPNIKPLFPKYSDILNTKSLTIVRKRNERLRSLIIQGDLWKSINEDFQGLSILKRVLCASKILRKFKVDDVPFKKSYKNDKHVVLSLTESLKNHSALVHTDFSMGKIFQGLEQFLNILTRRLSCIHEKNLKDFSFEERSSQFSKYARLGNGEIRGIASIGRVTLKFPTSCADWLVTAEWRKSIFGSKTLKSLSLEIWKLAAEKLLEKLVGSLQKSTRLENLGLVLNDFKAWRDTEEFKKLFEGISKMTSLQGVGLRFYQAREFDNYDSHCMESLIENLIKISVLQKLDLSFYTCPKLKKEGIEFLFRNLLRFEHLVFLRLDLSRCPKVDGEALKILRNTLKNMKSLKKVDLVFECCDLIKIEDVKLVVEDFRGSPISFNTVFRRGKNTGKVYLKNENSS